MQTACRVIEECANCHSILNLTLQHSLCMHVCTLRRRPQESAALRPSAKANELHYAGNEEPGVKRKAPTANPFARKQKAPKA